MTAPLAPPFAIAFQPIVDVETGLTIAQEALVRGRAGQSAGSVLAAVPLPDRYRVDAEIRRAAIEEALRLGLPATTAALTLNLYPGCVSHPDFGVRRTADDAAALGFPMDRLVFEISEMEPVEDPEALALELGALQRRGLRIALDDVGTGHARMPLLMAWRPDGAKIAREVIMGLDLDPQRMEQVRLTLAQLNSFGLVPVVEGVETVGEMRALHAMGCGRCRGSSSPGPGSGCCQSRWCRSRWCRSRWCRVSGPRTGPPEAASGLNSKADYALLALLAPIQRASGPTGGRGKAAGRKGT